MDDQMPVQVTVTEIKTESPSVKTFYFDTEFAFTAGQFAMVWVPKTDEIPMAFSSANSITVQKVGDATETMFALAPGAPLGIRGPLGNGFSKGEKMLAIAGGVGAAPLLPLARSDCVMTMLLGARTENELLFVDQLDESTDVLIATDDGSLGVHGYVTDLFDEVNLSTYDRIAVCGPEPMMRAVLTRLDAKGSLAKAEFSLHRYMKCGIGVCGSCCIDPDGLRVCRDGPVFNGEMLKKTEFGHYLRDACGRKKTI
ncbi:dihydroorotate dehydrogenase electron transfer subunit [Methanoregula sp. UBA64]|jgi:dihydroorotate dehydrogenase electron transfer subunit|uniref:dihydroorotate dehydrogenase electron transfer subunit n=1 Tax=Methanoregula sp. UBA64 TaxID=1915554 RepID=UPI0025DCD97F|nr:dihydroorotate dehydrogenase electron transfer subunit [Methanoregula sp. UBA64]